jgi:hypothetical protein
MLNRHSSGFPICLVSFLDTCECADYAARRSGGEGENQRRGSASYSAPAASSYDRPAAGRSSLVDPRVARRKSIDYAERRSGAVREEQRRRSSSSSYSPPAPSTQTSWDGPNQSSRSAPGGRAPTDPRVARRKSVDYAARRSGGDAENARRRSSSYSPPQAASSYDRPASSGSAPGVDPRVARRKSIDYSERRSGGVREEQRRRSSGSYSPPAQQSVASYDRPASNGRAPVDPRVARRKSIDYSERRSGGVREDQRRQSSGSYSPPAQQSTSSYDRPASNGRAPMDPRVARRKSVDYSARRSGGEGENSRRRILARS